jgi:hypothetical protein
MPKDFYSNDHSVQVGVPGSGDGSLQIDVEKDINLYSTGETRIDGIQELRLYSDNDIIINGDGSISITSGDAMNITVEDRISLNGPSVLDGSLTISPAITSVGSRLLKISSDGVTHTEFIAGNYGGFEYMTGSLPLEGDNYIFPFYDRSFFSSYSTGTDSNGEDCLELGTTSTITSYVPLDIPYKCNPENIYVAGESTNGTGVLDTEIHRIRINKATGEILTSVSTDSLNYGAGDFLHNHSFGADIDVSRIIGPTYDYRWAFKMEVSGQSVNSFRIRYIKYTWK